MRKTIEQRLVDSRPGRGRANAVFVERTMAAVRRAQSTETFERAMRTTNATKKERLFMKVKQLPKWAAIGLVSVAVVAVSGSAYAVYEAKFDPTRCIGNTTETCTSVYKITVGDQSFTNPNSTGLVSVDRAPNQSANRASDAAITEIPGGRTIQGKLISHDGTKFALRASSGDIYTITGSKDYISVYNTEYVQSWQKYNENGGNLSIALSDTLAVAYHQGTNEDPHHIAANEVDAIGLVVTGSAKAETLQKY